MSTLLQIHLPDEMLVAILTQLPQNELRKASRASRGFYRAAHNAGLVLHRRVYTEHNKSPEVFADVVKHAQAQRHLFRLGLTLIIFRRNEDHGVGMPALQHIWGELRRAMPFLVSLDIKLYSTRLEAAYTELDTPAPQLRTLRILVLDDQPYPAPIAVSLFGGAARCLRNVELTGSVLPRAPARIPAWRGVRELAVCAHHTTERLHVASYFPALSRLVLEVSPRRDMLVVDLVGLALDCLTVKNDSGAPLQYVFDVSRRPPRIRTVIDICVDVHYSEHLWPDKDVPLNAHIQKTIYDLSGGNCRQYKLTPLDLLSPSDAKLRVHTGETISVGSADSACSWRITQYTKPTRLTGMEPHTLTAFDTLSPLCARLVSLTIDDALLTRLLATPCTLAVLRELHVDCTAVPAPPPNWNSIECPGGPPVHESKTHFLMRCPTLERAALFATGYDTPVSVELDRIAALRLLRSDARLALVLSRVTVDCRGGDVSLLQDIFSSVEFDAHAVRCVPHYCHRREDNPRFSR